MTRAVAPASPPVARLRWRVPLVAGLCFGLGYGVVQRLMDLELTSWVQLGQPFDVREFPGTTLESLRLKLGAPVQSIRGDLGVLELEEQQRQADLERKRQAERQAEDAADEPLEASEAPLAPAPEPALETPAAPALPEPAPVVEPPLRSEPPEPATP